MAPPGMMEVVWTEHAVCRLDEVLTYVGTESPAAEARLALEIDRCVRALAEHAYIGRTGRVIGTRELVVSDHYILCYRVKRGRLEIVTVLHTRQQWPEE